MQIDTMEASQFPWLKTLLKTKGHMTFRVATGSMEPVIMTSSLVTVVPPTKSLNPFDIIVFWDGKRLLCHYVWHVNLLPSASGEKVFVTRGIRKGENEDFPINESDILGVVTSHSVPKKLRVYQALRDWFQRDK